MCLKIQREIILCFFFSVIHCHIFSSSNHIFCQFSCKKSLIAWLTGTNAHNLMVFAMFHASTILKLSMLWFQSFSEKFLWNRRGKDSVEGKQKLHEMIDWTVCTPGYLLNASLASFTTLPNLESSKSDQTQIPHKPFSHHFHPVQVTTRQNSSVCMNVPPLGNILPIMSEPRILW